MQNSLFDVLMRFQRYPVAVVCDIKEMYLQICLAWGGQCRATHKDVEHLQSNQEEADTKMILHAVDATSDGVTEIKIHSPDTDVLVLDLRRYPMLCVDASFVTGRGHNHREIKMGPIVQALGPTRTAALPAFSQGET